MHKFHNSRILQIFGSKVKKLRQGRAWSQEELGRRAGLHRTYIGSIERNERNISLVNIEKIASALGVPIDALIKNGEP